MRNISSPGYETSSSTAPTTSPDPLDYHNNHHHNPYDGQRFKPMDESALAKSSKESTPEFRNGNGSSKFLAKRPSVTKIEDRLVNFELKSSASESPESMGNGQPKKDLPKVDITKRREMFEREQTPEKSNRSSGDFGQTAAAAPMISIKERLRDLERQKEEASNNSNSGSNANRLSGDITSIKDRLRNLEIHKNDSSANTVGPKFDAPLGGSIKDRLSSLHSAKSGVSDTVEALPAVDTPKASAVVVGMAKKPQTLVPNEEDEQVIEVASLKVEIEQIQLPVPAATMQLDSLMTTTPMDSIQDTVQDYVTIIHDVKEKEEYREITDEDLFGGTDIDGVNAGDVEIDCLQQDMSVSSATDTVVNAVGHYSVQSTSDSLDDLSQLESNKTSGVQVIETLTILGNLLERSASNSNVGVAGKAEERINNDSVVNNNNINIGNGSRNNNSSNCSTISKAHVREEMDKAAAPAPKLPQSLSENCLATTTNRVNNNHHNHQHQMTTTERNPLKSSQSAFFDKQSTGDRYCILLINNSRR